MHTQSPQRGPGFNTQQLKWSDYFKQQVAELPGDHSGALWAKKRVNTTDVASNGNSQSTTWKIMIIVSKLLWIFQDCPNHFRIVSNILKSPSTSQNCHEYPKITLNIPRLPWTSQDHLEHSKITVNIPQSPWTFQDHREHLKITLTISRSPWLAQ